MTFPDQDILIGTQKVDVPGNCFQAALAGVLGLRLTSVPHFALLGQMHWMQAAIAWLQVEHEVAIDTTNDEPIEGYALLPHCIVRGTTERGTHHACVGDTVTGEVVHDPHPDRSGLTFVNSRFYFYKKIKTEKT
jgi:hypothetical protein